MIFDHINNARMYRGIHPGLNRALKLMEELDHLEIQPGRTDVSGDDLYVMNFSYSPLPADEGSYESHKRYADIQLIRSGEEIIRCNPIYTPQLLSPYDSSGDAELFTLSPGCDLLMKPGRFALFLPGELHAPKLNTGSKERVDKIVIKVRMD